MTRRHMTFALAAALMAVALAAPSGADTLGRMDTITFSGAVALPGVVLPAGSYVFEIANPDTSANVVRVIQQDTHRVLFAGFTERVQRPRQVPAHDLVTLGEARRGSPTPITAWYPGAGSQGHRFLY